MVRIHKKITILRQLNCVFIIVVNIDRIMTGNSISSFDLMDLKTEKIEIKRILLDPNNPRFIYDDHEQVPETRYAEDTIQNEQLEKIKDFGILDVKSKMKKLGFLTMDRVIVRPLVNENGEPLNNQQGEPIVDKEGQIFYVVLEGNRRISSAKLLKSEHERGITTLEDKIANSLNKLEVLVYEGQDKEMAWQIQGIRHLSGIKGWQPFQQAKFITKNYIDKEKMTYQEIKQHTSLSLNRIRQMVYSYYSYKQAKQIEPYKNIIEINDFALFSEAIFKKEMLKNWLGWDTGTKSFTNLENFKMLLSKYLSDDEDEPPKISRAIDVRDIFSKLVQEDNQVIFEEFLNDDISIEQANAKLKEKETRTEVEQEAIDVNAVLNNIESFANKMSTLPLPQIAQNEQASERLRELFTIIKQAIELAEKVI